MSAPKRRVLLVGWDSADWKVIHPLLDAGKLPHLEQLVNAGVIGNLATLTPALSPMLWTSIGTGKRPHKHGIHGFAEPDPHTGGVRPITNLSRQTKAVWNILSQSGKKCIVVGWWPSHPAEPLPDGVMVSNHIHRVADPDPTKPWPLPAGAVHPPRLADALAECRVHPHELVAEMILPFVPRAAEIDQTKDHRLGDLAKIIADCSTIQAIATQLIASEPWDFMAVYFDAIDHFGHGFMKYHPPRQPWVSEKDFELYRGVIEAGYRYHDMMLGVLMALAGPDTTVLLMSDHGFHPDNLRPSDIPTEPAGLAVEHRHYGIFALAGPGIKKDERITGATVLDITPTLLSLFDLPVGSDMDGKPLLNVFTEPPKLDTIPSWDAVLGADGSHPPGARLAATDAQEALKQLEALGYIAPVPEDAAQAVAETQAELDYNLACSLIDANRHAAAAEIFARLWGARPDEHRFGGKLLSCQLALGAFESARTTLEQLRAHRKKFGAEAAAELKRRREELKGKKPEDLTPRQYQELRRLAAKASPATAAMRHLEATLLLAEGRHAEAVEVLRSLEKEGSRDPGFLVQLGSGFLALKRWDEAEKAFKRALELDADNAHAFLGLARLGLALRRNFEAASNALSSVGLLYHNPPGHFLLAVALHRLDRIDHAVEALQVCLAQNPNFAPAHRRLAFLYERRLNDPERAETHRKRLREILARQKQSAAIDPSRFTAPTETAPVSEIENRESKIEIPHAFPLAPARADAPFITVVSGLPRSGTSLMMQMLSAGGLPPLHDGHRPADADNPRGYFEFAPAKNVRSDAAWVPEARGRVVKLIAQLLPFLPAAKEFDYRIVWMERSLDEVLASQRTMLDRHGRAGASLTPEKLRAVYEQQLAHVAETIAQRQLPVLRIPHGDAIREPAAVAARVAEFLGLPLDRAAMAAVSDPTLHRQKSR